MFVEDGLHGCTLAAVALGARPGPTEARKRVPCLWEMKVSENFHLFGLSVVLAERLKGLTLGDKSCCKGVVTMG